MTVFEIIILIVLYLFSFGYMANSFGFSDENNTWIDRLFIVLVAVIIGVIYFPIFFGGDIWNKLNKEE